MPYQARELNLWLKPITWPEEVFFKVVKSSIYTILLLSSAQAKINKHKLKMIIFLNNSCPLKYLVYENKLIKYYARKLKINRKYYGNITNTNSFKRNK